MAAGRGCSEVGVIDRVAGSYIEVSRDRRDKVSDHGTGSERDVKRLGTRPEYRVYPLFKALRRATRQRVTG